MELKTKSLNSMPHIYHFMASPSKEENILTLILGNSPQKEWHFEEIVREAKVTKAVANKWLKRYIKDGLLKRIKENGRFPYITAGSHNPAYLSLKRQYALDQLYHCGLIKDLMSLEHARTVIIFGSMIKGDWYNDSDIDIFILGDINKYDKYPYEKIMRRNIELHIFKSRKEIENIKTGLIKNVINGYVVKGSINDIAEVG